MDATGHCDLFSIALHCILSLRCVRILNTELYHGLRDIQIRFFMMSCSSWSASTFGSEDSHRQVASQKHGRLGSSSICPKSNCPFEVISQDRPYGRSPTLSLSRCVAQTPALGLSLAGPRKLMRLAREAIKLSPTSQCSMSRPTLDQVGRAVFTTCNLILWLHLFLWA
jgi:hypothetical protein